LYQRYVEEELSTHYRIDIACSFCRDTPTRGGKMHRRGVKKKLRAIINGIFQCHKTTRNSEFLPEYGLWELNVFALTMPALNIVARLRAFTGW
jgi:hypothetical protein